MKALPQLISPRALSACLLTGLLFCSPQIPAQTPPVGVAVGSTPAQSVRYAAAAVREQVTAIRQGANAWERNASSRNYREDQFISDFRMLQLQMSALRERFNWMAEWVLEMKRPYANNALVELDAGLNLIGELFTFLDQQYGANQLDQATVARTANALGNAMREWELELKKSYGRMGVAW